MNKNINRKINTKRGFTILETIVAIFILVISISGPLVFAQNGLKAAFISRDQISAFYLAQDGIETIKNIRDNNMLRGDDWLSGFGSCNDEDSLCDTDPYGETIYTNLGSQPKQLKLDNDYVYGYNGQDSRFYRGFFIEETDDDREARITMTVRWTGTYAETGREIVVTEYIYNWYSGYTP